VAVNCWACGKPAAGFSHLDLRYTPSDARRYRARWAFCSRRCQDAFHLLYDIRRQRDPAAIEDLVPMTLPLSPAAQRACLQAVGGIAEHIGFDVPVGRYNRDQALQLVEAVIAAYETCLQADAGARFPTPDAPFVDDPIIPF